MTPIYNPTAGGVAGLLVRRAAACAEIFLPAAPPAIVVNGAVAWVFGAYVDLGSVAQILVPSYLHVVNANSLTALNDATVRLSYAADRFPLDHMREVAPFYNPGATTAWYLPISMMCQPQAVPANDHLWASLATSVAAARQVEVILLAWAGGLPTFDTIPLAPIAGIGYWWPSNTGNTAYNVPAGAAWAYGAPVTVNASMPNDALVVGLKGLPVLGELLDNATIIQVGYGPAGSEVWCATSCRSHTWNTRWVWPPVLVKAGERLALRATSDVVKDISVQMKLYNL
jgi:hypothetical protein